MAGSKLSSWRAGTAEELPDDDRAAIEALAGEDSSGRDRDISPQVPGMQKLTNDELEARRPDPQVRARLEVLKRKLLAEGTLTAEETDEASLLLAMSAATSHRPGVRLNAAKLLGARAAELRKGRGARSRSEATGRLLEFLEGRNQGAASGS